MDQSKPFVCHGEPKPGRPCTAKLTQAEAWLPTLAAIRQAIGRQPAVRDLAEHAYCGRCSALGRKAGLRFYHYPQTVAEMEKRRIERVTAARQAFGRYLPAGRQVSHKERPNAASAEVS